jgi:Bacterial SH3 domain.
MEAIIFIFLVIFFVMWALPKCKESKVATDDDETTEIVAPPPVTTSTPPPPTTNGITEPVPEPQPEVVVEKEVQTVQKVVKTPAEPQKKSVVKIKRPVQKVEGESVFVKPEIEVEEVAAIPIYTVTESVNVRSKPGRDGVVLERIPARNTELYFLGNRTEATQKINMDGTNYNEPWLKVKTANGRIGWVYGGTVRFYKK